MEIKKNQSLKPFNTFGLDQKSRFFTVISQPNDIQPLFDQEIMHNTPSLILGGGSNILFTKDFEGIVVKNELKGIEKIDEDKEHVWLKVASGENWHNFVQYCLRNNFGGVENLSLIPGTVGAAPIQNIGAYGVEVKDIFESLEAFHLTKHTIHHFSNAMCNFGYRNSIFKNEAKGQYLILNVTFKLQKNHTLHIEYGAIKTTLEEMNVSNITIQAVGDAVVKIRQSKLPDPNKVGNAGSFFKNPEIDTETYEQLKEKFSTMPGYTLPNNITKIPAAWLIEYCGWKGKRIGNIGVHPLQALVLVHYGNGKGAELWNLAQNIQRSVHEQFGILLQPEVNVL